MDYFSGNVSLTYFYIFPSGYLLAHPAINLKSVIEILLKITTNIIFVESTGMMCPVS